MISLSLVSCSTETLSEAKNQMEQIKYKEAINRIAETTASQIVSQCFKSFKTFMKCTGIKA